jgi:hypothetical protein
MRIYQYLEDGNRKQINENGDIKEEIDIQKQRQMVNTNKIGGEISSQLAAKKKT